MSEVEIEKGIPIPKVVNNRHGRPAKYPWKSMEIGDSFVINSSKKFAGIHQANKRFCQKFTHRRIDADHVRVWRIE